MKILTDSRIWILKIIALLAFILLVTVGIIAFLLNHHTHENPEKACCESCEHGKECDSKVIPQDTSPGAFVSENDIWLIWVKLQLGGKYDMAVMSTPFF